MHIIKTLADVKRLQEKQFISNELAQHFERKFRSLRENLAPEQDIQDFNLETYGVFGVLEAGDKNLTAIGLPESLALVMPEWVSRLTVVGKTYFVLYIMADNDYIDQIYLPDAIMTDTIRLWLSEQPVEEETEGDEADGIDQSQPF